MLRIRLSRFCIRLSLTRIRLSFQVTETISFSRYKVTTIAATVLTMAGDAVRLLNFIFKKLHPSYFLHHTSSGFSQLLDDSPYLSGRECLAGGFIACLLHLFPEFGAAANPVHQMAHSRARTAIRKVHQCQLLLAVGSNNEVIHGQPPFLLWSDNSR